MGVKFLSQGNNSSRNPQPGIEPGTSQLPGRGLSKLLLLVLRSIDCYIRDFYLIIATGYGPDFYDLKIKTCL